MINVEYHGDIDKLKKKKEINNDMVEHVNHYQFKEYEIMDIIEEIYGKESVKEFALCNAFKYLFRCKRKHDNPLEDIKKARTYLDYYINLDEKE